MTVPMFALNACKRGLLLLGFCGCLTMLAVVQSPPLMQASQTWGEKVSGLLELAKGQSEPIVLFFTGSQVAKR